MAVEVWRAKDAQGNRREIKIEDMEDDHLQRAIYVVQKRKLQTLKQLKLDKELEEALRKESNRRSIQLLDIDIADNTNSNLRNEYSDKKEVIKTLERSVIRKENQLKRNVEKSSS